VAIKNLIEDFILPLHSKLLEVKSFQHIHISKLINLVNSKIMIEFMSELFCSLQDVYPKYAQGSSQMKFDQFAKFCRDYDIFPRLCSKPALYRIFHTLAIMKETLKPNVAVKNTKRML